MIPSSFPDAKEIARLTARMLLEIKAVHFNATDPFILASGLPSPTYIDCRKLIIYPRILGFAALVVVGDQKGRVGFGKGKAKEVPEAIRKATEQAKRQMIRVPLREGRTLHHDMEGRHGAGKVVMRTAPQGTGVIAGGPMRAVFEMLGLQDVVAKSIGSQNPYNMIRATMNGLQKESSPRMVAQRRGKKVADILNKGDAPAAAAEPAEA